MSVSSDLTNRVPAEQHTEVQFSHGGGKIKQDGDNSATPMAHEATPQASSASPTDGARDVTANGPISRAEIERMTEETLQSNPEYRELQQKLDTWKGLETDFAAIDAHTGIFTSDGKINLENLKALVNDPLFPDPAAKAAAQRLLNNMSIWNELAKGDNVVGTHDVTDFIAGMKNQLKAMKDEMRATISAEVAPPPATATAAGNPAGTPAAGTPAPGTPAPGTPAPGTPAPGTPAPGTPAPGAPGTPTTGQSAEAAAAAAAIMTEADQSLPKPAPSQFSGLEGASENMNNMIGWGESEIDRLTSLMGKTDDPAVLKQLENKINAMSRRMQQMTALMNQVMTAMQNISKMYSDIAMNSVRNMR